MIRSSPPVAVIDVGSNSIKLLVAARAADGALVELAQHTEETRLGTGITASPPRLREDAMERALESIKKLLCLANRFEPRVIQLAATSAVRDAANRDEFLARVDDATNHELRVLDGAEEARLIGRGIACDPALRGVPAFYLFDLGGGSLELLAFQDGRAGQSASLQLGCVRVAEACVADPTQPLAAAEVARIRACVREVAGASAFRFNLPTPAVAVATGGTATTVRAVRAAAAGQTLAETEPALSVAELEALAARLSALTLVERRIVPGLPAARADVFPAALWTLVEIARLAGVSEFRHSLYNLRYGLAAELLETSG